MFLLENSMTVYVKEILLVLLHLLGAFGLSVLAFLVSEWTSLALLPSVITLFGSVPILMIGVLRFYWESYAEIPPIAWICLGMMLFAGVLFGVGMLLA
jgi:hypothetical protein